MKIHYKKIEFAIVFLFLVIPPVFVSQAQDTSFTFSISHLIFIQAAIAFLLDFQQKKVYDRQDPKDELVVKQEKTKAQKTALRIKLFSQGAITLGCLFIVFALFQTAAFLFPKIQYTGISSNIAAPSSITEYVFCIINVIVCAYYEEVLYRQYLPLNLYDFYSDKDRISILVEAFPVLFFAASHLYLGWIGVLNALLCGIILRRCAVKTGSIYIGTAVHIIYNLFMFLVIAR